MTGSREWCDEALVAKVLAKYPKGTILVHGDAHGADRIAAKVGRKLGFDVRPYPANWDAYGNAAGRLRNQEMLDKEGPFDEALAFHDDPNLGKGTFDMVIRLKRAKTSTRVFSHAFPEGKLLDEVDSSPV